MCGPRTHCVSLPGPDEGKKVENLHKGRIFQSSLIGNEPAEEKPLRELTLMQRGLL